MSTFLPQGDGQRQIEQEQPLINVKDLRTYFYSDEGVSKAVDGINFIIRPRKILGMVGESGCGKSVTALSIMRLIPTPPGRIVSGEILYDRKGDIVDLVRLKLFGATMRSIRGAEIAMIFQDPMTALDPVKTVGYQIMETIMLHQGMKRKDARDKSISMLKAAGVPSPERRIDEYPHQMSGGMCQRVMIAMALSCNPSLLIADEPTTALDVTIQAQVLELINELRAEFETAILFITHDLAVIAQMADDVVVMYLGKIVESAPVGELFTNPKHPYTLGLLGSITHISTDIRRRLTPIQGSIPGPYDTLSGCVFSPRCLKAMPDCKIKCPPLIQTSQEHLVACWLFSEYSGV